MNIASTTGSDIPTRINTALSATEPTVMPEAHWRLEQHYFFSPKEGAIEIGVLPIPLQHLCVLAITLEEERKAEEHRRCVAVFGTDDYDNERSEFMIHCEVGNDPQFNQAGSVWRQLDDRIRQAFPSLVTEDGHEVYFFVTPDFRVMKTRYRKKTAEEVRRDMEHSLQQLRAHLAAQGIDMDEIDAAVQAKSTT